MTRNLDEPSPHLHDPGAPARQTAVDPLGTILALFIGQVTRYGKVNYYFLTH